MAVPSAAVGGGLAAAPAVGGVPPLPAGGGRPPPPPPAGGGAAPGAWMNEDLLREANSGVSTLLVQYALQSPAILLGTTPSGNTSIGEHLPPHSLHPWSRTILQGCGGSGGFSPSRSLRQDKLGWGDPTCHRSEKWLRRGGYCLATMLPIHSRRPQGACEGLVRANCGESRYWM